MAKAAEGQGFLGKKIPIVFDRPLGSEHPKFGWKYPLNYGYVPDKFSGDGEEIDVYYLSSDKPLEKIEGKCIGYVRRLDDNEDKLIATNGEKFTTDEIEAKLEFQEKWYIHEIVLANGK